MNIWTYVWLVSITILTLSNLSENARLRKRDKALSDLLQQMLFDKLAKDLNVKFMTKEEMQNEMYEQNTREFKDN